MIRRANEAAVAHNTNMRGGDGTVTVTSLLDKDKDEFYGKGRLFSRMTLPAGSSIGRHTHEGEMECFYVLTGEGLFDDNGVEKPVSRGDVLYTGSGEAHSIRNTGSEPLELMALILFK